VTITGELRTTLAITSSTQLQQILQLCRMCCNKGWA
jgi:hypothetical protein